MKSKIILLIFATTVMSCNTTIGHKAERTFSNSTAENLVDEKTESKSFSIGEFNKISADVNMSFRIIKANKHEVKVTSNAMKYIKVKNSNGRLTVSYDYNRSLNGVHTEVTVYTPEFNVLSADSEGSIVVEDHFSTDNLELSADSMGAISGNFSADKISVSADSKGSIVAVVNTKQLSANADSKGDIRISGTADGVRASADSMGEINIKNLRYKKLQQSTDSMGKVDF